jgi:putative membrane protein
MDFFSYSLTRPALHALLNGSTAIFLTIGWIAIQTTRPEGAFVPEGTFVPEGRMRGVAIHRLSMTTAFLLSTIFLFSYLDYHARVGTTRFLGTGTLRTIYFTILASHTVLATAVVPLVLTTLAFALKGNFDRHRKWARWTWPIWMYVCLTGVGIYFFLKYGQP